MLKKKVRKPRGYKLGGYKSSDMCPHCFSANCDPMAHSKTYQRKRDYRLENGLCVACGNKLESCSCKSKLRG